MVWLLSLFAAGVHHIAALLPANSTVVLPGHRSFVPANWFADGTHILQLIGGVVVVVFQALTLSKSYQNGQGIQQNRNDLTGLGEIARANQADMVLVRQAMTRIQGRLDGVSTDPGLGRRATDAVQRLAGTRPGDASQRRSPGTPAPPAPPAPDVPRTVGDTPMYDPKKPQGTWPIGRDP